MRCTSVSGPPFSAFRRKASGSGEITGSFTHDPNPLVTENLAILQEKIAQTKPDLGVAFDGDADRCIFLTEWGAPIGCDLITALLAADFLKQPPNKGSTVVYDLRSSHVVADEVKAAGGIPRRERVGHAYMKKTLAETRAVFGGELSGHFYFRDNFFADSGAIAFARVMSVLSAQAGPMSELMAPLRRYAQSGELNFQIEDKDGKIRELADIYRKAQIDYLDGITVDCGDWWFNVRKSNTEPLLRLNLEARDQRRLSASPTTVSNTRVATRPSPKFVRCVRDSDSPVTVSTVPSTRCQVASAVESSWRASPCDSAP